MDTKIIKGEGENKAKFNLGATQKLLAFGSLIVLLIFFSLASENFFQFGNLVSIMLSTAVIGVLGVGVTFVIITGGIDLSVGTVMTFSSVIAGVFISIWEMPILVGVLAGLLAGALCGFLNGVVIAKMKIPAFIATLGMMMVTKGLSLVISDTKPIYFSDYEAFSKISLGSFTKYIIPGAEIPNAVVVFFGLALVASFILSKTILGRYNFSIGSNEEATRLSGINVDAWKIAIHSLCGLFCGVAGILMASRLNSAQPALGQGYELEAIAAVVIGGTSLNGGEGSILGTVIGALLMSVLTNGLRILSVKQEWQTVVIGFVVIGAVFADIIRRKRSD